MFPRKYNAVLRDVAAKIRPITLMNITENPVESIHSDDATRIADLKAELSTLSRQARRLSTARLVTFCGIIASLFLVSRSAIFLVLVSLPALACFVGALVWHTRTLTRRTLAEKRKALLEEAQMRKASRRRGREAPEPIDSNLPLDLGERVFDPEPESVLVDPGVVEDLDLLRGNRSLFGFLDLSATVFGARRLQHFLTHLLTDPDAIRSRQGAVKELTANRGLRDALLETLFDLRSTTLGGLPKFLAGKPTFDDPRIVLAGAHILGTLAPALVVVGFFWTPALSLAVLLFVLNMAFAGYHRRARPLRERIVSLSPLLRVLLDLSARLESADLESKELTRARESLGPLVRLSDRLQRHISLLELQSFGSVFEFLNILTLIELRILPLTERLVLENRLTIESSIGVLGEIEALLSLSGPLVEQKNFTMPEALPNDVPQFNATALGHPLLESDDVVANPVDLGGDQHVWLVTGSNMAGKSTFLKGVGTNLTLAGAGGPVCAKDLQWTPVALYTDINVRDSLDDGKSYFQVEVERIRDVLQASAGRRMILAIFDELFRGTNSVERLAISRSIIRRLRTNGILLLVATHDLSLTELVTRDHEAGMANFHLREEIRDGTMAFDYVLREGPATSRNAIQVLEVSGYPQEVVDEARDEARE